MTDPVARQLQQLPAMYECTHCSRLHHLSSLTFASGLYCDGCDEVSKMPRTFYEQPTVEAFVTRIEAYLLARLTAVEAERDTLRAQLQQVVQKTTHALDEARRTISVGHPVRDHIEYVLEELKTFHTLDAEPVQPSHVLSKADKPRAVKKRAKYEARRKAALDAGRTESV